MTTSVRTRRALAGALAVAALIGSSSAPASAADPVLAAAGDIACQPGQLETPITCRAAETARIVAAINPTAVAVLGDNQYEVGGLAAYRTVFDATWGAFRARTFPVPGNHEYYRVRADGYYGYFGAAAGDPAKGYYAYDLGDWHVLALNSNCAYVPCAAGSEQEQWVRQQLAARAQACTLAYWHHALYSSQGGDPRMRDIWNDLVQARADVVLSGHNHNYERFAPQDAGAHLDPLHGPREFVVGTGGRSLGAIHGLGPNSELRQDRVFGVLALTLSRRGYAWSYDSVDGSFSDTGSTACHDKVPPTVRLASVRPGAFRAAGRGRFVAAAGSVAGGGAVLRFRLSEAALVGFTLQRAAPGRRFRETCLPVRRRPSGSLGCTRWLAIPGAVERGLPGGHNRLLLSGRLGGRRLAPGRYRLVAAPTDRAQNQGAAALIPFRIVR
jgi:acid phosphatase type 7